MGYGAGLFKRSLTMNFKPTRFTFEVNTPSAPARVLAHWHRPLWTRWVALLAFAAAQPLTAVSQVAANPSSSPSGSPSAAAEPATPRAKGKTQARPERPQRPKAAPKASQGTSVLIGSGPAYAERAEAMDFAERLALERGLPAHWLRQTIGQARRSPLVMQLMQPPSSPFVKNWRVYRSRFIEDIRIQAGLRFWQTHEGELNRAESIYGVPPEIVVGIIGVETLYGRHMGQFRVMDALATLAFDFPARHPRAAERSEYFRKELEQFLLAQHRSQTDPFESLGSYAGATGMPQFMPSSIASFAVDFDKDGRIDLRSSVSDVIGSVAHYLKAFNWKPGMPTHYRVELDKQADLPSLLAPDILPTFSAQVFQEKGALLQEPATSHTGPLALIELLNGSEAPTFVAGTENFYVITRYNWSSYYAMAVIELGQEIARRKNRGH